MEKSVVSLNLKFQYPEYDMVQNGRLKLLRRGYTTGAERFFYLDKDQIKLWNIEQNYYKTVITNPRKIQHPKFSDTILDEHLLTVYEPKDALKKTNVKKYIEHGESRGYHLRQTTKTKEMWYSSAKREPSP